MRAEDDATKVAAKCEECGSIYAAWKWPDGKIQLIGGGDCPCGSSEFTLPWDLLESDADLPTENE